MNNIENLLRHQQEGSLTPEELDELNRLTHRDRVLQAAAQQARTLRRRQYFRASAVASVLIVAGICFLALPSVNPKVSDTPILAQSEAPSAREVLTAQPAVVPDAPAVDQAAAPARQAIGHKAPAPAAIAPSASERPNTVPAANAPVESLADELSPSAITTDDPIVACNTECSPDSVINDIWKFLRA